MAVDAYDEHARLRAAHPALIARQVADAHQRHTTKGRTVAITTNTAETARAINTEIQHRLDPTGRRPRLPLADGTQVSVGDQIATRRNDPVLRTDLGEKVRNRHTWTVTVLGPSGELVVEHPNRGIATLPADYVNRHVELGWAVTGYGNQGDTADVGLAVLEPGTTRNHAYVALTRGRQRNHAWIPDPTGTLDPADALTGMMTRQADRGSALATHAHLHRQTGEPAPMIEHSPAIATDPPGAARQNPTHEPPGAAGRALEHRVLAIQNRMDQLQAERTERSLGR